MTMTMSSKIYQVDDNPVIIDRNHSEDNPSKYLPPYQSVEHKQQVGWDEPSQVHSTKIL